MRRAPSSSRKTDKPRPATRRTAQAGTAPKKPAKKRRGRPPARESEAMREKYGDARVIKRYGNRRLYDGSLSRCVTLEEIAEFVRHGEDVRVIDADSGDDITRRILTQIILEESSGESLAVLPIDFLRKIISLRDDALAGWMQQYLSAGTGWLERQMDGANQATQNFKPPVAQAMQESMSALFPWLKTGASDERPPCKSAPPPSKTPPGPERGEDVRDEINELQRRLAELASRVKRH